MNANLKWTQNILLSDLISLVYHFVSQIELLNAISRIFFQFTRFLRQVLNLRIYCKKPVSSHFWQFSYQ
jgi:hypothetical protein